MDLTKYVACICEGAAEKAIMEILLDADKLIFKRDDLLEGELTENGIGVVLRKKVDKLSELFIFRRKRKDEPEPYGASATKEAEGAKPQKEENGEVEKTEN